MEFPTQIEFHGMERSEFVERAVEDRVKKLARMFPVIVHCRVVVEAPHHGKHQGRAYQVKILLKVPKSEIVVDNPLNRAAAHTDVYVALRDSFRAARQQLQEYHGRLKLKMKHHEGLPMGWVVKTFPEQGYGFIAAADGSEVYFDANAIIGVEMDKIDIGQKVRFAWEMGEDGPQATSLYLSKSAKTDLHVGLK